jgi:hypothetical protein
MFGSSDPKSAVTMLNFLNLVLKSGAP